MEATADYETIKTTLAAAANEHGEPHWLVERRLAALDAMQGLAAVSYTHLTLPTTERV